MLFPFILRLLDIHFYKNVDLFNSLRKKLELYVKDKLIQPIDGLKVVWAQSKKNYLTNVFYKKKKLLIYTTKSGL